MKFELLTAGLIFGLHSASNSKLLLNVVVVVANQFQLAFSTT